MINNNKVIRTKGFTIVELLVVIVVIGILAAITLVSYTSIAAKANGSTALSSATQTKKKMLSYYAEKGIYPATFVALNDTTQQYYMNTTGLLDATILSSGNLPTKPAEVNYVKCGTTGSATVPTDAATITVVSGIKIGYWDYGNATPQIGYVTDGYITDPGTFNTFPSRCFPSTT